MYVRKIDNVSGDLMVEWINPQSGGRIMSPHRQSTTPSNTSIELSHFIPKPLFQSRPIELNIRNFQDQTTFIVRLNLQSVVSPVNHGNLLQSRLAAAVLTSDRFLTIADY